MLLFVFDFYSVLYVFFCLLAISFCNTSLFLLAYSCSSISYCVPHFSISGAQLGSVASVCFSQAGMFGHVVSPMFFDSPPILPSHVYHSAYLHSVRSILGILSLICMGDLLVPSDHITCVFLFQLVLVVCIFRRTAV